MDFGIAIGFQYSLCHSTSSARCATGDDDFILVSDFVEIIGKLVDRDIDRAFDVALRVFAFAADV